MAQTLQTVPLHQPHRARIIMWPYGLAAVALGGASQPFGDEVERVVPRDRFEGGMADALAADPAQRHRQALGVVLPLGVAADLGANDTIGVALGAGAANAADAVRTDPLDLERAGARAVVRAYAERDVERQVRAPAVRLRQNNTGECPESIR